MKQSNRDLMGIMNDFNDTGGGGQMPPDDDEDDLLGGGQQVLCIKCKRSLDDMQNIREAIEGPPTGPKRLTCHWFRSLLPNLRGARPARAAPWVRRAMRAILHAVSTRERARAALTSNCQHRDDCQLARLRIIRSLSETSQTPASLSRR